MKPRAIMEQSPIGFRYRVLGPNGIEAASVYYKGFEDAMYALHCRFPTIGLDEVEVT